MPYTTKINHSSKIIRNTYSGVITREDLAEVWRHLLSLKEFTALKYNLLSDYRNSKFHISTQEEDGMLEFLISIKDILKNKKEAAILSDPKDTALSMILQSRTFEKVAYITELFSTEKAAMKWLNDPGKR